jgi:hypothetical protein
MMTRRLPLFALAATAVVALGVACTSSTAPDPPIVKPPASLHIVTLQPNHPQLYSDSISFMAIRGQSAEQSIYFADAGGGPGEEYVRFRLDGQSLLAYPDGTPFKAGDSVRITIRVINPDSIYFQFDPAGLKFDPAQPARLTIKYDQTGGDYDGDHQVTAQDSLLADTLAIWRQPNPTDSFTRLQSIRIQDAEEIEADVLGFSRYALAF